MREVDQLLIICFRFLEVLGILLDLMQWYCTVLPGHGQADIADVGGVGQAADGDDVLWQFVPDVLERLGFVHARSGKAISQY